MRSTFERARRLFPVAATIAGALLAGAHAAHADPVAPVSSTRDATCTLAPLDGARVRLTNHDPSAARLCAPVTRSGTVGAAKCTPPNGFTDVAILPSTDPYVDARTIAGPCNP